MINERKLDPINPGIVWGKDEQGSTREFETAKGNPAICGAHMAWKESDCRQWIEASNFLHQIADRLDLIQIRTDHNGTKSHRFVLVRHQNINSRTSGNGISPVRAPVKYQQTERRLSGAQDSVGHSKTFPYIYKQKCPQFKK